MFVFEGVFNIWKYFKYFIFVESDKFYIFPFRLYRDLDRLYIDIFLIKSYLNRFFYFYFFYLDY